MNLFAGQKVYAAKYVVKEIRKFSDEEKAMFSKAEVVPSQYGTSACFFMKQGGNIYFPMDENAKSKVGATLDIETAEIVTLGRPGDPDIIRIRG